MLKKTAERSLKHRAFAFKAEKVAEDGTFKGYGSVFGNVDSYGEVVQAGAFADSLERIKASGDPLPALWQHRAGEPIGGFDVLAEDEHGLQTEGWLLVNDIPQAKMAHTLMKRRVVKGLSIGYFVEASSLNEKTGIRTLEKLDLQEISIVTFPANAEAQVEQVKAAGLKSIREFEGFLRDVGGFSAQRAKAIASRGWNAVDEARDGRDDALVKTFDILQSFSLERAIP